MEGGAGHRCHGTKLETGQLFGPDLIKESEQKVKLICDRLKVAQSRHKSYADPKRKETVYKVGDRAYLEVSPLRGRKRFGVKGKVSATICRTISSFGAYGRSGLQVGIT